MDTNATVPAYANWGRLIWMALGPMVLAITTLQIVFNGTGWHTVADYVYFGTLAAMVLGRWLEVLGGQPRTSEGELATPRDFRRYVAAVLIAGLAVWGLANAFGNHGGAIM